MTAFLADGLGLGHVRFLSGLPRTYKASSGVSVYPTPVPQKLCHLTHPTNSSPSLPMPSGAGFLAFPALPNQTS
jgi:hypothetical protein